jgi:general secretion pathway protein N
VARTSKIPTEAPWFWAGAGAVLGLLAACVAFAPARWLASSVERASGGHLQLADPRGTVWEGSAQLLLTGGAGSSDAAALPGRISWDLQPRWDGAAARVRADCCMAEAVDVRYHWGWGRAGLQVGDSVSQWPAAVVSGLGTPWNTLQLDGSLRLTTQGLSVEWAAGRPTVAGRAELVAQRVASRLSTLKPMGSYRITLQGGTQDTLRLETLEGSLQLSGTGQWVGQRLHFRGEASAAPEREEALANLLNIIGRRNGARSLISIG